MVFLSEARPRDYKTILMLNLTEYELHSYSGGILTFMRINFMLSCLECEISLDYLNICAA